MSAIRTDIGPTLVGGIASLVKDRTVIQGGSFRLDRGPTATETRTFEMAVALLAHCLQGGKSVRLSLLLNDLGLVPADRPKSTGSFEFPASYRRILQQCGVGEEDVLLMYESSLRNRVRKDGRAAQTNRRTGIKVAVCANIMGRYYQTLADLGFTQQVGFYAREPKPETGQGERGDTACPFGPMLGAVERRSGYKLRLSVLNYSVHPDGAIRPMCSLEPDRIVCPSDKPSIP